jgi:CHAD domain-containing protein
MLGSDEDPHPGAKGKDWLEAQLAAEHDAALGTATHAMLAPRYVALLDTLQSTVDAPPWAANAAEPACRELPAAIRRDWQRLRKTAKAADRATTPSDRAARLHDVRKAAKRTRYSTEAVEPAFGRDASRFALALAGLQTVLGDHHDDVVTSQKLRDLAGTAAHESDAFNFADIAARLDDANRTREGRYRAALSQASRSKRVRWLEKPAPGADRGRRCVTTEQVIREVHGGHRQAVDRSAI